jgi:uncharacterized protein YbjQ (UPF0145 family)
VAPRAAAAVGAYTWRRCRHDYETVGNNMLMVSASGTAVKLA